MSPRNGSSTKNKKIKERYWHELTSEQQVRVRKKGATNNMSWDNFMEKFMQPGWCVYQEALGGILGCWKLLGSEVHGIKDCNECECSKENKKQ